MKIFKLTLMTYLNHIFGILISVFMGFPLYNLAQKFPILFSLITTAIYTLFIYSYAWNIGYRDARRIPGYEPSLKTPLMISVFTMLVPIALLVIRLISPDIWASKIPVIAGEADFFALGCRTSGTPDFLYRFWFFHLAAFVPNGNLFLYVAELFFLPILFFIGYCVGVTRFSISAFLRKNIVFKGSNQNKNR